MEPRIETRERLKKLKWGVVGFIAIVLALVEAYYFAFYFVVWKPPLIDYIFDWLLGMTTAFILIEIFFRVIYRLLVAIETERLYEAERCRAEELAVLNEIGRAVSSVMQLDDLLELISQEASRVIDTSNLYIALYDAEKKEISFPLYFEEGERRIPEKRPARGGMTEYVINSAKPLMINHDLISRLKELDVEVIGRPSKSWLGVSLLSEDRAIGVLAIQDYQNENAYDESHLRLLSTIASQAAIAIENARLYEVEQERRQEAETLHQAAQALSATLDLQEVFGSILSELQKVVPYDSASVQLLKGDRLEIIGGHGFPNLDELLGLSFPLEGDNPNRQVMASRAPFIVEDAPAIYSAFREEPHGQAGIRAWLGVPLLFGDRMIGMIALDKKVPGFYTEEHARLAQAFAAQAAIAIENARLYEEERQRAEELHLLFEATRDASTSLELDEVLERVAANLCGAAKATSGHIMILDESGERATVRAQYWSPEASPLERTPDIGTVYELTRHPTILQAMRENRPLVTHADDPNLQPETRDMMADFDGRSALRIPMYATGILRGYALIWDSRRRHEWLDEEVRLCQTLASQAAVAIENARLYEEEQRRGAQRRTIAEVGRRAAAILEMDSLLSQVVDLIAQNFGYYHVHIFQIKPDSDYAVYKAGSGKAGLAIAEKGLRLKVGEEGIIGWVAQHGQPLLINDVGQESRYYPHPALPDTRSELAVPIRVGRRIIGVLDVQSTELGAFDEDDLETLRTLADQLAVAMENARLYEEERKRSEELSILLETAQTLASSLDLEQVLEIIASRAKELTEADGSRIYLLEPDEESLKAFVVLEDYAEEIMATRVQIGQGITGHVAATGIAEIVNHAEHDPRAIQVPGTPEEAQCLMCAPLKVKGEVIGVMTLSRDGEKEFEEGDLPLLTSLASQAATAIENARLYEKTKQLAITDSLTGLYNLRYLYRALEKEIQRCERYQQSVSFIILDIDALKAYNDLHGHLAGDDLLIELAQLMSKVTRQTDILTRYGGDEFAIILPETEPEGARLLAERLQHEVRGHRFQMQDGQTIGRITISLGVATYPHDADSAKALVDAADKALLRAKQAGKNRLSVWGEKLAELEPA